MSDYRPDAYYHCFTLDHDAARAAAIFTARYGQPPEQILEHAGLLRLGPVPASLENQRDFTVAGLRVVVSDDLPADMVLIVGANGSAAQVRLFA